MLRRGGKGFGNRRGKTLAADKADDPGAARLAAIAQLGRRDFASGELRDKLLALGYQPAVIETTLEELADEHLLDDARYATHFVTAHAARGQGPLRIRQLLKSAGLAAELTEAALAAGPDWHERARDLRQRRFGAEQPDSWKERARQMRFLQYRGFSNDHIRSALGTSAELDEPDSEDPA